MHLFQALHATTLLRKSEAERTKLAQLLPRDKALLRFDADPRCLDVTGGDRIRKSVRTDDPREKKDDET